MDKDQVAAILSEIGTLLEIQGENPFRCQAYHNGARAVAQMEEDLGRVIQEGRLTEVPGIGATLRDKIVTLVSTGKLPFYEDLRARTPPGLLEMMRIQGMGPKKVKVLHAELGIKTLEELKAACESGAVARLRGFGVKTQQKILEGLAFVAESGQRVRLDQAEQVARPLYEALAKLPGVRRIELCGSLRRRRETIKDIDILISSDQPGPIMDHFVHLPRVERILGQGDTKSSVLASNGGVGSKRILMNVDLRIVSDDQFPFALHYFTGSKDHNIGMRVLAQNEGLKLNEYELAGPERRCECKTEGDVFKALGLQYVPPELREHTGELDAAANNELPRLVEAKEIQGVFHCHTVWSDGGNTVEEMARAARELGLHYLGLGDHSQSLAVANGMSPERVRAQQKEIDAVARKLRGFTIFKGIECDILADGSLDYEEDILATFDYVVASVHTHFQQAREEMTDRIVRAVRNPYVTMLGHATGRLLLRRDAYAVDLEAVLQAAGESDTMIEINAHPVRLDLDWIHCKRARALGIKLVVNPDAHSTEEIALYKYGVDVARRAWLRKEDVFNTLSAAQVKKELARRKP